ncbi:terminase [Pendulispora rubella]|uniref:Terminase n=1 Tax=Pendulispora rubella TaxID=2741070 RepID=A0ABZ2KXY7_9BACT
MNSRHDESVLARQWNNYRSVHHSRKNLLIHLLMVPVFMAGTVSVGAGVVLAILGKAGAFGAAGAIAGGLFAMILSIGLQGVGHKAEERAPEPFAGPKDVVLRIFAEQWITFPRYVLSGQFARALSGS